MKLAHPWPSLLDSARARVEEELRLGCLTCKGRLESGAAPIEGLARLVVAPASQQIKLQCLACGRGSSRPFPHADHPDWRSYPEFDGALLALREAERDAFFEARRQQWDEGYPARQADYAAFLQTPEWRELRDRVMRRAGGICEACLKRPAEVVHHKSYVNGWLCPAFDLAAVCRECHDKIHSDELSNAGAS
jgi:hypothetical protein